MTARNTESADTRANAATTRKRCHQERRLNTVFNHPEGEKEKQKVALHNNVSFDENDPTNRRDIELEAEEVRNASVSASEARNEADKLALEKLKDLRAQRQQLEARASAARRETLQLREEQRQMRLQTQFEADVQRVGIRWSCPVEDIRLGLMHTGVEVDLNDAGQVTYTFNGKQVTAAEAFEALVDARPFFASSHRTAKQQAQEEERRAIANKPRSKDELRSREEKIAFINRFGLAEWEALPLHGPVDRDLNPRTMSAATFLSLPRSERAAIAAQYGCEYVSTILRRK